MSTGRPVTVSPPVAGRLRAAPVPGRLPREGRSPEHGRDRMSQCVACLSRNRDAISEYLEAVRDGDPPRG